MNLSNPVPLVLQPPISIVAVSGAPLEAVALRGVLEGFNYRVETHWIGSRRQFLEVVGGAIPTFNLVVVCCHGTDAGIVMDTGEPPVSASDLADCVRLPGRVVVASGCGTGTSAFASAFLRGGCRAYLAPSESIDGNAALLFLVVLFYLLQVGRALPEAIDKARAIDPACSPFRLYDEGSA